MKRTWAILLGVAAVVGAGAIYFARPGDAPPGQPALVEMNGAALAALQSEFNRTTANVRVILLLSPT